jgi:hypothetical protein
MSKTKKVAVKLGSKEEAEHISKVAHNMAEGLIAGETLRLALPIARLIHEKVFASYKRIEHKYGKVE